MEAEGGIRIQLHGHSLLVRNFHDNTLDQYLAMQPIILVNEDGSRDLHHSWRTWTNLQ